MSNWDRLRGHAKQKGLIRQAVTQGRLGNAFLWVGPTGIGKRTCAEMLAKTLLCDRRLGAFDFCDECRQCKQISADAHPDVIRVRRPLESEAISIDAIAGERDERGRAGLGYEISLRPAAGRHKVAIIDDADHLSLAAANSLLKTLEEPPAHSLLILIGTSDQRQLPTIRSRCQTIRFAPLTADEVTQVLLDRQLAADRDSAAEAARLSGGSVAAALEWFDDELRDFRQELLDRLATSDPRGGRFAVDLLRFVEAAGKDASLRRRRMIMVLGMAVDFFREAMRAANQLEPTADAEVGAAARRGLDAGSLNGPAAAESLERTIDAISQVSANAHLATLIEAWLVDLATARDGSPLPADPLLLK